jgi:ferredoxin
MTNRRVMFLFPKSETEKPIVSNLVRDYNLVINIFRAKVTPEEYGYLVLDISGKDEDIARGIEYVKGFHVQVNEAGVGVSWDEKKCTHCGACLPHCPTHALRFMEVGKRTVAFFPPDCVDCLACLKTCPFGACASLF